MNGNMPARNLSSNEKPIRCTAARLSQFTPEIVQTFVPEAVFGRAYQYFAKRRARVIYASERKVVAEVEGTGTVYQQTIRLTDGKLFATCSCHSDEQPLCRHCVAAVLAYNRLVPDGRETPDSGGPGAAEAVPESSLAAGLHEIMVFIEWLQEAVGAVKKEQPLPAAPSFGPGDALGWVRTIQKMAERVRCGEMELLALQKQLGVKEEQVRGVAQDLEAAQQRVAETQRAYETVQCELETCREATTRLVDAEREHERVAVEVGEVACDMLKKASELERLIATLRNGSDAKPALAAP